MLLSSFESIQNEDFLFLAFFYSPSFHCCVKRNSMYLCVHRDYAQFHLLILFLL